MFAPEADFGTDWGVGIASGGFDIVGPGSLGGQYRSPWEGTGDEATGTYFSVGGTSQPSPQSITFDAVITGITMLIGSVDSYNSFLFNEGGAHETLITGTDILTLLGNPGDNPPEEVALVRFQGPITSLKVSSTQAAAEFAVAAVPVPFAGLLLLTGVGGAAAAYRRKQRKAA